MIKMYSTKQKLKLVLNSNNAVKTTNPTVINFGGEKMIQYDNLNVNSTTNIITYVNHGFNTGEMVRITQINAGNVIFNEYTAFIRRLSNDTFTLHTTLLDSYNNTNGFAQSAIIYFYKLIKIENDTMTNNYRFNLDIPYTKFSKNARLSVNSFYHSSTNKFFVNKYLSVYIKNMTNKNIYDTNNQGLGTNLLTTYSENDEIHYINNNIELNSIELNDGSFLNNGIDIYIETNRRDVNNVLRNGCLTNDEWSLELIIYDIEEQDMIYKELSNQVKNTPLYPLQ